MVFVPSPDIYDALPIPSDALDKGGVEMLRAGVVEEELFVTARRAFTDPAHWGYVLADITRRLAALCAAQGELTEVKASAAIVGAFARSLRASQTGTARKPARRRTTKSAAKSIAKSAGPRRKAPAKPSTRPVARRKGVRAKP